MPEKRIPSRQLTGESTIEVQPYETEHRKTARKAAADGFVLLRNEDHLLPLEKEKPIALYGAGAVITIKGGTGSGEVNSRPAVNIREGLEHAGFTITTKDWLDSYEWEYVKARNAWKDQIWEKADSLGVTPESGGTPNFFDAYVAVPFVSPAGSIPKEKSAEDTADTAIYVLSRTAGEGCDRRDVPGDYRLTENEHAFLSSLCRLYAHVVLTLNTGGLIGLSFLDEPEMKNIGAILYIHQPGMEGGNAFADVVSGKTAPSGKLTDSWADSCADYPCAETFDSQPEQELYTEGIYVGYRYFDTFEIPVRYGFGYGLTYTEFEMQQTGVEHFNLGTENPEIGVHVRVTNTGGCAGREVVQVYASCPQGLCEKEYRRLSGFAKTGLLEPGQAQDLVIRFPLYALASYLDTLPGWILEAGEYILTVGNSLENTEPAGMIIASHDLIFSRTGHICTPKEPVAEMRQSEETAASVAVRRMLLTAEIEEMNLPQIHLHEGDVRETEILYDNACGDIPNEVRHLADNLTDGQRILLVTGENIPGQFTTGELGNAGAAVPGSAAQTSSCAKEQGLASIVLADGPAGLRLNRAYTAVDGKAQPAPLIASLENGFLLREDPENETSESGKLSGLKDRILSRKEDPGKEGTKEIRYQYCTAFPTGTCLAQSWDPEVFHEVGRAVGEEMVRFGVTLWLAPGMNIHRSPLCGRNFEYFSEDPLVAGLSAAAMTEGVQSAGGIGTTVKHFACNSRENNRKHCDSILSERALREIYLKGFEICIRKAQPAALMTSYNLVNGVHAANSFDLCTKAARSEWGFQGVIMTDWTTTMDDPACTASGCMRAGNDLVMPGSEEDHENLRKELEAGTLSEEDLKRSAARVVNTVWNSRYRWEEVPAEESSAEVH